MLVFATVSPTYRLRPTNPRQYSPLIRDPLYFWNPRIHSGKVSQKIRNPGAFSGQIRRSANLFTPSYRDEEDESESVFYLLINALWSN